MPQPRSIRASCRARLPRLAAVALLVATGTLLGACGRSGAPSSAAKKEQLTEQKAETKFADLARCLREHGAEVEVRPGGRGLKLLGGRGGFAAAEAAYNACARYRPEPQKVNISAQQKIEQQETSRKFAKCIRSHGIHLPEAKVLNTGGGNQMAYMPGVNPQSPALQAAMKVCGGPKR
jgi:hypothetical protein